MNSAMSRSMLRHRNGALAKFHVEAQLEFPGMAECIYLPGHTSETGVQHGLLSREAAVKS